MNTSTSLCQRLEELMRRGNAVCTFLCLGASGGKAPPEEDTTGEAKVGKARRNESIQLEEDGLIRQRATGKLAVPKAKQQEIMREAHDLATEAGETRSWGAAS